MRLINEVPGIQAVRDCDAGFDIGYRGPSADVDGVVDVVAASADVKNS
jgi:hypothetical protein